MDKKALELLGIKGIYDIIHKAPSMQAHEGEAWAISEHLYREGYRKLPEGKPPLLSKPRKTLKRRKYKSTSRNWEDEACLRNMR